jgi:hypothetical protein
MQGDIEEEQKFQTIASNFSWQSDDIFNSNQNKVYRFRF